MKPDNVPGCEGYYISPRGHLYTRVDPQGRLTPRLNKKGTYVKLKWRKVRLSIGTNGYYSTRVYKNYECIHLSIHRLVAQVYIPNPDPSKYSVVMHLDNNRLNNRVSNLKWGTVQENVDQMWSDGRGRTGSKYDVNGIIEAKIRGVKSREVAKVFGLSRRYVDKFWLTYKNSVKSEALQQK